MSDRQPKPSIRLANYGNPAEIFVLSLEDETLRTEPAVEGGLWISGYGCQIRLGLLTRRRSFAALYTDGSSLFLRVDNQTFMVGSPGFAVRKQAIAPFIRRVQVKSNGSVVFSSVFFMSSLEFGEWPTFGDFWSWVVESVGDRRRIDEYIYCWTALGQGKRIDSPAFQSRMARRVRQSKG